MLKKKKLIIPLVVLVLGLGAAYSMAKPQKTTKLKIPGTIYVMPQPFLLNLSGSHYAKLSVALDLSPEQSTGASAASAPSGSEGPGTLPEEAAVREIVTNAVTGQSGAMLVSGPGRNAIKHHILDEIKQHTDVKVEAVLFPEVTVQ